MPVQRRDACGPHRLPQARFPQARAALPEGAGDTRGKNPATPWQGKVWECGLPA